MKIAISLEPDLVVNQNYVLLAEELSDFMFALTLLRRAIFA